MSCCDTFAVCSRLLSLNHSPSHPFILCPYPQSALPSPPLPHYCPIRSVSRPALTNHNTSKPGGGVKKVTGVGGTTYEISVWVTGHPSWSVRRRWGTKILDFFHFPELDIIHKCRRLKEWLFEASTDWRSSPVWYQLVSFQSNWPVFSASLSDLNKEIMGTVVNLSPFSHFESHRLSVTASWLGTDLSIVYDFTIIALVH